MLMFVCLLASSCKKQDTNTMASLSEATAIIEENHEQAYIILKDLDVSRMNNKERAMYSMLMSMALDKKYIDITNDSLIAPAVKYYKRHGNADEKLKTSFYYARVLENSGDIDAALEQIVEGEKYVRKAKDNLFIGRYYLKKSILYSYGFQWEKALQSALMSQQYSSMSRDYRLCASAMLSASSDYYILHETDSAMACLSYVRSIWDKINDYRKGEYYRLLMTYCLDLNPSDAESVYEECLKEGINPSNVPYVAISDYFIFKKNSYQALLNLGRAVEYRQLEEGSKEYEYRFYKIKELSGDYSEALESMKRYYSKLEKYEYNALTSDSNYIEEKIQVARKIERNKGRLGIFAILVLLSFAILVRRLVLHRKRQRILNHALASVEREKAQIEALMKSGIVISKDMRSILSNRVEILNKLTLRKITGGQRSERELICILNSLEKDRDGFILGITMQYSLSNPFFIHYLKEKGLTDWEIGICCLYVLGLSGKEISGYILSSSNVYNISSRIRQKLGLSSHDTNLSKYLGSILANSL